VAKTYTAPTTVSAGDAITASLYNTYVGTNVANLIVPPAVRVIRTTSLGSYTNNASIAFESSSFDTDSMFSVGSPTVLTVNTTGLYLIEFAGIVSGNATITRILPRIKKNTNAIAYHEGVVYNGNESSWMVSTVRSLTATDTISASVGFVGGSGYTVFGNATESEGQTSLAMTWIGRTS